MRINLWAERKLWLSETEEMNNAIVEKQKRLDYSYYGGIFLPRDS